MNDDKMLEYVPVRLCEFEMKDEKIVTVLYNKFEKTWLDKIFKKLQNKTAKIDLDKIGSVVWLNCDGESNVLTIVEKTQREFEDEEAIKNRVILFLNQLASRHFIQFFEHRTV